MNKNKIQDEIRFLVNKKVDLELLQKKFDLFQESFIEVDSELVAQFTKKLKIGQEDQQCVIEVIEQLQNNDLSSKDISKIQTLIKKAQVALIDFPQLKQLETVKFIPSWIKKLQAIILPKKAQTKSIKEKSIQDLTKELIHYIDQIDSISLSKKLKANLKENIEQGRAPEVFDKSLSELYIKIKTNVWIKEAFDLLGKERYTSQEINELKESQVPKNKVECFKTLKYKYSNFKEHIDEIYEAKNEFLNDSMQVLNKFEQADIDSYDQEKDFNDLQKTIEDQMKKVNEKVEKVQEVKENFYKLQKYMEQMIWAGKVQKMVINREKKSMVELQIMYKKAIDLGISKNWRVFQGFEELYNITQTIQIQTEKIRNHKQKIQQSIYNSKTPIHEFFNNNTLKIKLQDALEIKEQVDLLIDKINLDDEMNSISKDLQKCEDFQESVDAFIGKYHTVLQKDEDEITKEEFENIETDMYKLNEQLFQIPIYLGQKEQDLFTFEWCVLCFSHLLGFKKNNIEQWAQLIICADSIKEPNQKLIARIGSEIEYCEKILQAVSELKEKEKLKLEDRIKCSQDLRTLKEVQSLQVAIEKSLVDCDSEKLYVQNIIDMAEKRKKEIQTEIDLKPKNTLKMYKQYINTLVDSLPFSLEEEFQYQEMIQEAEKIKVLVKNMGDSKQKQFEMASRYKLQKIYIKDAEEISKNIKQSEDSILQIEQAINNFQKNEIDHPMTFTQFVEYSKQLESLEEKLPKKRVENCQKLLFICKLRLLETSWEKQEEVDTSFKEIYELFQLTDKKQKEFKEEKLKYEIEKGNMQEEEEISRFQFIETMMEQGYSFLKKIIASCEKKIKQIKQIRSLKQLENIIQKEDNCFCGFVNLTEEINKIKDQLIIDIKREKELEKKMVESSSSEEKAYIDEKTLKKQKREKKERQEKLQRQELREKLKDRLQKKIKKPLINIDSLDDSLEDTYETKQHNIKKTQVKRQEITKKIEKSHVRQTPEEKQLQKELDMLEAKRLQRQRMQRLNEEEKNEKLLQKEKLLKLELKIQKLKEQELLEKKLQRRKMEEQELKRKLKIRQQKEQQIKNEQIKNKLIGDISNKISDIEFYNLSIDQSVVIATKIFNSIENTHTIKQLDKIQKNVKELCKMFTNISIYKEICLHIKNKQFDTKYMYALIGKSDSFLEQEDKKLSIQNYIQQKDSDLFKSSFKIQKKSAKLQQKLEEQNQQNAAQIKQSVAKQDNLKYQISNVDPLQLRQSEFLAKKSISRLIEKKSMTKGGFNNNNQTYNLNSNRRRNEFDDQQFSDDEDNTQDQQMQQSQGMTEEDYQELKEIYKIEQMKYAEKIAQQPIRYNPDNNQQDFNIIEQNQFQQEQNLNNSVSTIEPSENISYQFGSYDFINDKNIFEKVKFMSMHSKEDVEQLPLPNNTQLKLQGTQSFIKVQEYFLSIFQQQQVNQKNIILSAGWLESMNLDQQELLNEYAAQLQDQERIAIVEWGDNCKLYLLHTTQIPQEWFEEANFQVLSQDPSKQCYLQFFCMFKAYKLPQLKTYTKVKVVELEVDLDLHAQYNAEQNQNLLQDPQQHLNTSYEEQDSLELLANQNEDNEDIINQRIQELNTEQQINYMKTKKQTKMDRIHQRQLQKQFGNPNKLKNQNNFQENYNTQNFHEKQFFNKNQYSQEDQFFQQNQNQENEEEDNDFENEMQQEIQQMKSSLKKINNSNNNNNTNSINVIQNYGEQNNMDQSQFFEDNQDDDSSQNYQQQQFFQNDENMQQVPQLQQSSLQLQQQFMPQQQQQQFKQFKGKNQRSQNFQQKRNAQNFKNNMKKQFNKNNNNNSNIKSKNNKFNNNNKDLTIEQIQQRKINNQQHYLQRQLHSSNKKKRKQSFSNQNNNNDEPQINKKIFQNNYEVNNMQFNNDNNNNTMMNLQPNMVNSLRDVAYSGKKSLQKNTTNSQQNISNFSSKPMQQQQPQKQNQPFLRTRESSIDSTTSAKVQNIIPIQQNNFIGTQQNDLNNSKLKNSFLLDKEIQNQNVNAERLKQFRY